MEKRQALMIYKDAPPSSSGLRVDVYLACDVDARIAEIDAALTESVGLFNAQKEMYERSQERCEELERELDIRKAAIDGQFALMEQVRTLTRSNDRLRDKLSDRPSNRL